MIKSEFNNYLTLISEGIEHEKFIFLTEGKPLHKEKEGSINVEDYYWVGESQYGSEYYDINNFLLLRAELLPNLLYRETVQLIENTAKEELVGLLIEYKYQCERIRDGLLKQLTNNPSINVYYEKFIEGLEQIQKLFTMHFEKNSLEYKVNLLDNISRKDNNNTNPTSKIKWLGNVNVLITLFYDMLKGQDGNAPLIEADEKVVKSLIFNNFSDAEGNELSTNTLETYFRRTEDRAPRGTRIELCNVKLKKSSK
jgi:hypothetical protein